jgi:hypothetical protein
MSLSGSDKVAGTSPDDPEKETARIMSEMRQSLKDTPYDDEESRLALNELETSLKILAEESGKGDESASAATAEIATVADTSKGIVNSLKKFSSDDKMERIQGAFDIIQAGAALVQPYGKVIVPIFKLLGKIFIKEKAIAKEESVESVLRRVIKEALDIQTSEELRSLAVGEMDLMLTNLGLLQIWIDETADDLKASSVHAKLISGTYEEDGIKFSAQLNFYIQKGWNDQGNRNGYVKYFGKYLSCYAQIYMIRRQLLFLVTSLYAVLEDHVMVKSTQYLFLRQQQMAMDNHGRFKDALAYPEYGSENNAYNVIHELSTYDRIIVEAYLNSIGIHLEGYVCTIVSDSQSPLAMFQQGAGIIDGALLGRHLGAIHLFVPRSSDFDHERLRADPNPDQLKPIERMFRKISLNSTEIIYGEKFETFRLYALSYGGYLKIGGDAEHIWSKSGFSDKGNTFFIEARKIANRDDKSHWFVDKEGRLTNIWASKKMFPWLKLDSQYDMLASGVLDNSMLPHTFDFGKKSKSVDLNRYFTKGFEFNKTNSD